MLQPDIPFTFETYKSFVDEVDLLQFEHAQATYGRRYSDVRRLTQQILLDLPPVYRSKLPEYLLARCPICGGTVREAIDTFSLSGIGWWISEPRGFGWFGRRLRDSYELLSPLGMSRNPEPSYQTECDHVRAVAYGVNLNGIIPDDNQTRRMFVVIGSERPGLLKPFMEQEGSWAVIHTLPVGRLDDPVWAPRYTAYFISYFNEDVAVFEGCLGSDWYDKNFLWPYELLDYDLVKWLEAGRLFWLGSEAEGYPLRQEPVDAFPYVQLNGLVGRWAVLGSKGAILLPPLIDANLYNPNHPAFHKVKSIQEEALRQRRLKPLRPSSD